MSEQKTYRQMRSELDEIMTNLHTSDLDIDHAIKQYEQGMKLIKELEAYLKKAELKIKKVTDAHQ